MKISRLSWLALAALLVLTPASLSAQVDTVWVNRWTSPGGESDWAYAIAVDDSGHIYVTGKTENPGTNGDWTTIKYYPNGDTAWIRNFASPGTSNERANAITIGPSGNIYLTGYTMSSSAGDYLTIKYRPNGDTAWTARYNGVGNGYDFAHWVAVDDEENVYVTGYSRGFSYQNDIATVKYDSLGNQLWAVLFNGTGNYNDKGHKVIAGNDGYIYVAGYVNPFASGTRYDYVTIKYDASGGDTVWARTYNGTADSSDMVRDIEVDASGNVYVTGSSRTTGALSDIITIKYNALGTEQWTARYNNPDTSASDGGYGLEVDGLGNVYVVGQSQGLGTGSDIVTIKYDSTGNDVWVARYNGPANDYDTPSDEEGGKCMTMDQYANIYVTGVSRGATSMYDYVALKYDSAGIEQWVAGYNCCDSTDYALAVATDNAGSVYICGRSVGGGTYYDMATVKYYSAVGVQENKIVSAERLLLEVHPNPAQTRSTIRYALPYEGRVSLSIYDVSGRLVKTLVDQYQKSDIYSVIWKGKDTNDRKVAPGVYFCILSTDGEHASKKVVTIE
ncbi:MAG: SBBP repeat-containing protein [bacterium]